MMLPAILLAATTATPIPCSQTPDEILERIESEFGPKEAKYDKLLDKVRAAVFKHLAATDFDGAQTTLIEHPRVALVESLQADVLQRVSGGKRRKNRPEVAAILERLPWHAAPELARGLEFGSDRPVPANQNGFIVLELPEGRLPGYPEFAANYYVWGTGEIVGWQARQKKNGARLNARTAKDVVDVARELPSHEALRVLLTGNLPEASLFAIPELQHRIHSRLVERRTEAAGETTRMDEFFAMIDAAWNGFSYQPVYAKEPIHFAVPLHVVMADQRCFPYHFANSAHMKSVGDLPFTAVQTYCEFAELFLDRSIEPADVIGKTGPAVETIDEFIAMAVYLGRYRALIDLFVRAIVSPEIPLPGYLRAYDYPASGGHAPPASREVNYDFDVPRRHALLVWAACDQDPEKVADWLFDSVLSKPKCAFPTDVSLVVEAMLAAREQEPALLERVVARIERDRADGLAPGPFEREFSPFLSEPSSDAPEGTPNSNALAHSFHGFHAPLSDAIASSARAAVEKALK